MFFPYRDDNPRVLYPYVNFGIIGLNIIIFLSQYLIIGNNYHLNQKFIFSYGFIPANFNLLTIFTSMFMHGGFIHILGNMWFLYLFGDNVESLLGHVKYFIFYLFCGTSAAIIQFFIDPNSQIPMVGASGAIAGVLGAYMIRFPKARVHVLAVIVVFFTTIIVPAQIVLGLWFLMQLSNGLSSLGVNTNGGVAWFAHIGGFIAGITTFGYIQKFRFEKV
tara:strand:+ start:1032 stop:1688 length:657 start_codon:yes stop_codon:yes gene_type:complete